MLGTYVIRRTPRAMISRKGKAFLVTSVRGLLKREEDKKRFRPKGGVRKPNSRLARKITPRWRGSTPKAAPRGTMRGAMATMAAYISTRDPTIKRRALRVSRKRNWECMS